MSDITNLFNQDEGRANGFRALAELTPDFVMLLDRDRVIRYTSPAVESITGYCQEELLGKPFSNFIHPDDMKRVCEQLVRVVETGDLLKDTFRYSRKSGGWVTLETLSRSYFDAAELRGIMVSTLDVTKHIELEKLLHESAEEMTDLYENAPFGYHSVDEDGRFTRINNTELNWLQCTKDEVVGKMGFADILTPKSKKIHERAFPLLKERGFIYDVELELVRKDGSVMPVVMNASAIYDVNKNFNASRTTLLDITERKNTEKNLYKVTRALRVLSACNNELLHAENEQDLLVSVCRIIVEIGNYPMAWIGFAEDDNEKSVRPVAQAGFEKGYLDGANISWGDTERGRGPTGTSIRTRETQVSQNIDKDPKMAPWHEEALKRGFRSSVAVPLSIDPETVGSLMVYAEEPDAFDKDELHLLEELANDLMFVIETIRLRDEHKRAQEMAQRLAYYDSLTGLPNRVLFMESLANAIDQSFNDKSHVVLLTISVDSFSDLRLAFGLKHADELLKQIAGRIREAIPENGLLTRVGENLFAVLLTGSDVTNGGRLAEKIQDSLHEPFSILGISLNMVLNIGIAASPGHGTEPEILFLRSSMAASKAGRTGSSYTLYSGESDEVGIRRLALISDLQRAIEKNQLILHYQPKINLNNYIVTGVEALVRWQHPERGIIYPGEFISVAEYTGLIISLTYWVLDAALTQSFKWSKKGLNIPVAVNISPMMMRDPKFLERVQEIQEISGVGPEKLHVELTETAIMEDYEKTYNTLNRLKELGVKIYIDDFGTGYSSLSYAATLPVDALKIHNSFVMKMLDDTRIHSLVEAALSLAHNLGFLVVGEGAELLQQVEELKRLDCEEVQGFFFSPPLSADECEHWISGFNPEKFGLPLDSDGSG